MFKCLTFIQLSQKLTDLTVHNVGLTESLTANPDIEDLLKGKVVCFWEKGEGVGV